MAPQYSNKNPPPVDLTPPPLETYASKFPGSPEEQSFARIEAMHQKQSALNQQHAGRRRRRRLRGGSPDDPPANHIIVPQTHTGIPETSPQNSNTNALQGTKLLINSKAQAQYDSLVQFTPSMTSKTTPKTGGRRRKTRKKRHRRKTRKKRHRRKTRRRRRRKKRHRRKTRKKRHRRARRKGGGCSLCFIG